MAEALAHTDNRDDTEADRDNKALPVEDEDCEGDLEVDTDLLDIGDKLFDIEFILD